MLKGAWKIAEVKASVKNYREEVIERGPIKSKKA